MPIDYEKAALRAALQTLIEAIERLNVSGTPILHLDSRLNSAVTRVQNLLRQQ